MRILDGVKAFGRRVGGRVRMVVCGAVGHARAMASGRRGVNKWFTFAVALGLGLVMAGKHAFCADLSNFVTYDEATGVDISADSLTAPVMGWTIAALKAGLLVGLVVFGAVFIWKMVRRLTKG